MEHPLNLMSPETRSRMVFVTGPAGAGRTTAIRALEDIGFEAIDNIPLSLVPRLTEGGSARPLALGLDTRNRDFSVDRVIELLDTLTQEGRAPELMFLDCADEVLLRRYSETRRRHPLAPAEAPGVGIARERDLLRALRQRADVLIDTGGLSPHDLRAEIDRWYGADDGPGLAVSLQSFSYKRGLPRGADMVFDCRFLRNPYWDESLRGLDGRDGAVADFVGRDARFADFVAKVTDVTEFLLPGYIDEGKSHLTIAFGCTGGQHRSVAVTEHVARTLAEDGWRVSIRHRELDRNPGTRDGDRVPGSDPGIFD